MLPEQEVLKDLQKAFRGINHPLINTDEGFTQEGLQKTEDCFHPITPSVCFRWISNNND